VGGGGGFGGVGGGGGGVMGGGVGGGGCFVVGWVLVGCCGIDSKVHHTKASNLNWEKSCSGESRALSPHWANASWRLERPATEAKIDNRVEM